ncbi:response regulator transcription factor [Streptomyces sp. NPDC049837]|uniref:response regulator transcription factor n=1 Tax=Streptomyces sp. NPDC049837 TaxID=3155277 RepID=UPI00342B767B
MLLDACPSGADALADGIGTMSRPPRVCVLSHSLEEEHVAAALAAGASGYVLKTTPAEQLIPLVRFLADGWTMFSADISRALTVRFLTDVTREASAGKLSRLTGREREILVLLGAGLSNAEIALRLHLGLGTVKDHVSSILGKLDVSRRVQAALLADRAGLLTTQ